MESKKRYAAEVISGLCKSCGYCKEVCPKTVFGFSGQLNRQGYDYMITPGTAKCIGCGACVMICPDFAIRITEWEQSPREADRAICA